jgi:hypothetical protein
VVHLRQAVAEIHFDRGTLLTGGAGLAVGAAWETSPDDWNAEFPCRYNKGTCGKRGQSNIREMCIWHIYIETCRLPSYRFDKWEVGEAAGAGR